MACVTLWLAKMTTVLWLVLLGLGSSSASVGPILDCPDLCSCRRELHQKKSLIVDCAGRGLHEIPSNLNRETTHLDLSGNQIMKVTTDVFKYMTSLSTLRLNDNWIRDIEPHAFKGLFSLRTLDLSRNSLTHLLAESMSGLSGASDCTDNNPCGVNLQDNPLKIIHSYAFSWCKHLSLLIGNAKSDLTIQAYAFYGAENVPRITVSDVPSLNLEPRVFTNTDMVHVIKVANTHMKTLNKFTFEGLKTVKELHFINTYFDDIEEFAFSGIIFAPASSARKRTVSGTDHNVILHGGGVLNISRSVIQSVPTDAFRDTNLATLVFTNNMIDSIESYAFRGLHQLAVLEMSNNQIGAVRCEAFGGLRNVGHLKLMHNVIEHIEGHAFKDSNGIDKLSIHIRPHSNLTLPSYSFSGLRDVGYLEIKGASGTTLSVHRDAFHDLGDVYYIKIANVSLPFIGRHTFRGLSKVQTLTLEYCNISKVDRAAFGDTRTAGAVASVELKEGNSLSCDCNTNQILRDFENRFPDFSVTCYTDSSEMKILTADALDWPTCQSSSTSSSVMKSNPLLLVPLNILTTFLIATHVFAPTKL